MSVSATCWSIFLNKIGPEKKKKWSNTGISGEKDRLTNIIKVIYIRNTVLIVSIRVCV